MRLEGRHGAYLVGVPLGAGGMATVHRAVRLGARVDGAPSVVAIKRLHPHVAADPSIVTRFRREATISQHLDHPNIVRTIDVVEGDPAPALVMELCDGGSLLQLAFATWNRGEGIAPGIASAIVLDLLGGLGAAHEARTEAGEVDPIIHRDVSPHNVLVGRDGVTKLTDFGIARVRDWTTSTGAGDLKGKISYMAPELFSGRRVSVASDLYGAGVVLWELCANERLFEGEVAEILGKMLAGKRDELDLTTRGLPAEVDAVVMRAIASEPERRYESAAVMADALRTALPPATRAEVGAWVERASLSLPGQDEALVPPSSATLIARTAPPPPRTRNSRLWIGGMFAAVLGGGVAFFAGPWRSPAIAEPPNNQVAPSASVDTVPVAPSAIVTPPPPPEASVDATPSATTELAVVAPPTARPSAPGRSGVRTREDEQRMALSFAVLARGTALSLCQPTKALGAYSVTFLPEGEVIVSPVFPGERDACVLERMTSSLQNKVIPSDGRPITVSVGVSGSAPPN